MTLSAHQLAYGRVNASTGTTAVYTVPTGRRAIIRDVRVEKVGGAAASLVIVGVDGTPASPAGVRILSANLNAGELALIHDGFVVLEQTDSLTISTAADDVDYVVSGHEFVLP